MANVKKNCNCNTGAYAIFKINTAASAWGSIVGDILNQEDLQEQLTVLGEDFQGKLDTLDEDVQSKIAAIQEKISDCLTLENVESAGNIELSKEGDKIRIQLVTTVYEQGEASDTWVINHGLNKYPSVVLVDSAGTAFNAEITYDSLNQLTVKINGATKGKAYLN